LRSPIETAAAEVILAVVAVLGVTPPGLGEQFGECRPAL
jgi:hypothetical protein